MSIKAVYQHHERSTLAAVVADLQAREIGIDGATGYAVGYSETLAAAFYIPSASAQLSASTIPMISATGRLSDSIISYAAGQVLATAAIVGSLNLSMYNTNAAGTSHAELNMASSGAAGGDAKITMQVLGVASWGLGVDNSDSDALVISADSSLGTNNALSISTALAVTIPGGDFSVTRSSSGGTVTTLIENSNSGAGSGVLLKLKRHTTSTGDLRILFADDDETFYSLGLDTSAGSLVFCASEDLGGNPGLSITASNVTSDIDFYVSRSSNGTPVTSTVSNTSNTASSDAKLLIQAAGTSAGDAFTSYSVSGAGIWSVGVDNSASDTFVIAASAALGTSNIVSSTSALWTFPIAVSCSLTLQVSGTGLFGAATALTGVFGSAEVEVAKTSNGTFLLSRDSADTGAPTFEFLKRRSAWGVVSSGDRLGSIGFSGADSVDAAMAAQIYAEVDGTPGSNDMPGRLIFAVSPDGSATTAETFRLSSTGMATFTSINSGLGSAVVLSSPNPNIQLYETDAGADSRRWDLNANGSTFVIRTLDDAFTAGRNLFRAIRSGLTTSAIEIGNGTDNATLSFLGTGLVSVGGALTVTGKLSTAASATGGAGLILPHGTAPTSPVNGDMWTTTAGLYIRINGATVGPLS